MPKDTLSVTELRSRVEALGVDLRGGDVAGYSRFETNFALGSIEIAYGEAEAVYEESTFPGVVYPAAELEATVVVSGDGTVSVVDAEDEDHAADALADAIETLDELYLTNGEDPVETEIPADEIPFALDPPHVKTLGRDPESE